MVSKRKLFSRVWKGKLSNKPIVRNKHQNKPWQLKTLSKSFSENYLTSLLLIDPRWGLMIFIKDFKAVTLNLHVLHKSECKFCKFLYCWRCQCYIFRVGWLGFMTYQPLLVIYCQIHFYTNNQFYFKQFRLTWVHSLIVKNISISSYSF